MSRGKHLSLSEARKSGKLERFGKEHEAVGDGEAFAKLLTAMASGQKPKRSRTAPGGSPAGKTPAKAGTSGRGASAGSSGTRSRRDSGEGT